jgi:hypothetical protein
MIGLILLSPCALSLNPTICSFLCCARIEILVWALKLVPTGLLKIGKMGLNLNFKILERKIEKLNEILDKLVD